MIYYRQTEVFHKATDLDQGVIESYARDHQVVGVLPFINVSRNPRLDSLSSSITHDVVEVLANSSRLNLDVRRCTLFPSNTNVHIGVVGCCFDVELLMLGSIRATGGSIFVIAQLICVTQCCPRWTFRYHGDTESKHFVPKQLVAELAAVLAATD